MRIRFFSSRETTVSHGRTTVIGTPKCSEECVVNLSRREWMYLHVYVMYGRWAMSTQGYLLRVYIIFDNLLWKLFAWFFNTCVVNFQVSTRSVFQSRGRLRDSPRHHHQEPLPLSFWDYCYCFSEPGSWIRCVLVSFLAVGVGLDPNPWDWFWIGFSSPRIAIGLVLEVCSLDWFWIGFKQGSAFLFRKLTIFQKCKSFQLF